MYTLVRAGFIALAFFCSMAARAQDAIPPALRDWQGWVLHGEEFRRCPFAALPTTPRPGEPIDASDFRCVWPERLTLAVDARGGTFSQRWQVYAESWVALPGNAEHWPRDVQLNGAPAPWSAVDDVPSLRLKPGSYTRLRPLRMELASRVAAAAGLHGHRRSGRGRRARGAARTPGRRRVAGQAPQRRAGRGHGSAGLSARAGRDPGLSTDAHPAQRRRAKRAKRCWARALPDGFTPLSLRGDLPARLERDGTLRVQLRAGSHEVILVARGTGVASTLGAPRQRRQWPREEIWSFAANDALRVAAPEGAEGIDPAQANVPARVAPVPGISHGRGREAHRRGTQPRALQRRRQPPLPDTATLWLDFDHGGFTVVDNIQGTMRRDWRLDMQAPFTLAERAPERRSAAGHRRRRRAAPASSCASRSSISTTVARKESGGGAMPATGWDGRFDQVDGHAQSAARPPAARGHRRRRRAGFVVGALGFVERVRRAAHRRFRLLDRGARAGGDCRARAGADLPGGAGVHLAVGQPAGGAGHRARRARRALPEIRARLSHRELRGARRSRCCRSCGCRCAIALYPQLEGSVGAYGIDSMRDAEQRLRAGAGEPGARAGHDHGVRRCGYPPTPRPLRRRSGDVDSIDAEDIGAVPESNVSESLQRVPGVSMSEPVSTPCRWCSATPRAPCCRQVPAFRRGTTTPIATTGAGRSKSEDTVRFIYVGPVVLFFWRLIGVVALGGLVRVAGDAELRQDAALSRHAAQGGGRGGAGDAHARDAGLAWAAKPRARGCARRPGTRLLAELKTRLTAAPACAPHCAEITAARVTVEGDRLEVVLQVSALANVAVAMPHASDRWQLDEVSVDARGIARHGARRRRIVVGAAHAGCAHGASRGPAGRGRIHAARVSAATARRST